MGRSPSQCCQGRYSKAEVQWLTLTGHRMSSLFFSLLMLFSQNIIRSWKYSPMTLPRYTSTFSFSSTYELFLKLLKILTKNPYNFFIILPKSYRNCSKFIAYFLECFPYLFNIFLRFSKIFISISATCSKVSLYLCS